MIVAFTGKKGSGKDYAARVLEQHDSRFVSRAFVDPLKSWIKYTFKIDSERVYDEFKRKMHPIAGRNVHGRDIVRDWGMAMRAANENVFLDYMTDQVNKHKHLAITDLRFTNELLWCQQRDVIIIKIVAEYSENDDHESEQGLSDRECNYVIMNPKDATFDKSLKEVFNQLEKQYQ